MTDTETKQLAHAMRELATAQQQRDELAGHICEIAEAWRGPLGELWLKIKAAAKAVEDMQP